MSSESRKRLSRREMLRLAGLGTLGALAASCAPQVVEVTKEVPVEVTREVEVGVEETVVVKETVMVPEQAAGEVLVGCPGWWLSMLPWVYDATARYNDENPDKPEIKLVRGALDIAKLALEARSGTTSYDCFAGETAFVQGRQLIATEALVPWDEMFPEDLRQDVFDVFLEESTIDGHLWYWPSHGETPVVHWRKSMLEEVGHESPGDTWADFEQVCKDVMENITAEDGTPVWGTTFDLITWRTWLSICVNIAGKEMFTEEGLPDVTHPAAIEALEQEKALVPYAPPEIFVGLTAIQDIFASGRSAMHITLGDTGRNAAQIFGFNDWAFQLLPAMPDAKGGTRSTTWSAGYILFKNSQFKTEVAQYLDWLYRDVDFWKQMVMQGQFTPVFKHLENEDWLPDWTRQHLQDCAQAVTIPNALYFLTFHTHFMDAQKSYLQGDIATAEEALNQAWTNYLDAVEKM